jgi:hypothetical protein
VAVWNQARCSAGSNQLHYVRQAFFQCNGRGCALRMSGNSGGHSILAQNFTRGERRVLDENSELRDAPATIPLNVDMCMLTLDGGWRGTFVDRQ